MPFREMVTRSVQLPVYTYCTWEKLKKPILNVTEKIVYDRAGLKI